MGPGTAPGRGGVGGITTNFKITLKGNFVWLEETSRVLRELAAYKARGESPPTDLIRRLFELLGGSFSEGFEILDIVDELNEGATLSQEEVARLHERLTELTGIDYRRLYVPPVGGTAGKGETWHERSLRPARPFIWTLPEWMETIGNFPYKATLGVDSAGQACVVGKEYGTKRWKLLDRTAEVPVVEGDLAKLPGLFELLPGANPMEEWARPELIRRLVRWWEIINIYRDIDAPIPVVSAYRRLGTSVPVGKPEPDWCGARDSNDRFGHWRGLAIDLQTEDWREYNCGDEELPLVQFDMMAEEARLFRPWKTNDPTHWTVIERAEGGSLPWP